jgi:IclR family transcriptional regulator, acetate operon repressor
MRVNPTSTATDDLDRSPAATLTAGLRVLEAVVDDPWRSLSELARATGFSLNRTFRLLAALEAEGYVARDGAKTYRPGPMLVRAGLRVRHRDPLLAAATGPIGRLAESTGEAVSLACRVGLDRVVVDVRTPAGWSGGGAAAPDRVPAYWGALGYGVLAFAPESVRTALARAELRPVHGVVPVDRATLERNLDEVRRTRVWATRDATLGLFSVAAPVVLPGGEGVASLGIAGALTRFDAEAEARLRDLVRDAAAATAATLGGSGRLR